MIVKTAHPMSVWELVKFTKHDAIYNFCGHKARILSASAGQEIDVDLKVFHRDRWWGLKKVKDTRGKKYKYTAFLINEKEIDYGT